MSVENLDNLSVEDLTILIEDLEKKAEKQEAAAETTPDKIEWHLSLAKKFRAKASIYWRHRNKIWVPKSFLDYPPWSPRNHEESDPTILTAAMPFTLPTHLPPLEPDVSEGSPAE
tara:strand:+ start:662 stop:1006 length:345 start_codon:yes stop_codon:yes gene_type:complete